MDCLPSQESLLFLTFLGSDAYTADTLCINSLRLLSDHGFMERRLRMTTRVDAAYGAAWSDAELVADHVVQLLASLSTSFTSL
jgi:hypothetical protein